MNAHKKVIKIYTKTKYKKTLLSGKIIRARYDQTQALFKKKYTE